MLKDNNSIYYISKEKEMQGLLFPVEWKSPLRIFAADNSLDICSELMLKGRVQQVKNPGHCADHNHQ